MDVFLVSTVEKWWCIISCHCRCLLHYCWIIVQNSNSALCFWKTNTSWFFKSPKCFFWISVTEELVKVDKWAKLHKCRSFHYFWLVLLCLCSPSMYVSTDVRIVCSDSIQCRNQPKRKESRLVQTEPRDRFIQRRFGWLHTMKVLYDWDWKITGQ